MAVLWRTAVKKVDRKSPQRFSPQSNPISLYLYLSLLSPLMQLHSMSLSFSPPLTPPLTSSSVEFIDTVSSSNPRGPCHYRWPRGPHLPSRPSLSVPPLEAPLPLLFLEDLVAIFPRRLSLDLPDISQLNSSALATHSPLKPPFVDVDHCLLPLPSMFMDLEWSSHAALFPSPSFVTLLQTMFMDLGRCRSWPVSSSRTTLSPSPLSDPLSRYRRRLGHYPFYNSLLSRNKNSIFLILKI